MVDRCARCGVVGVALKLSAETSADGAIVERRRFLRCKHEITVRYDPESGPEVAAVPAKVGR